jgi:prefoldin subunit 5
MLEKPWDDMTPDERRDEMDRAAAELLRRLRAIVPELEGITADVETIRREIDEIRNSLAGICGLLGKQRRREETLP